MSLSRFLLLPIILVLAACESPGQPSPTSESTPGSSPPRLSASPASSPLSTPSATTTEPASASCENPEGGYAVEYPADWWANERVEAQAPLEEIPPCAYFAPDAVELEPGTDDLSGVAIRVEVRDAVPEPSGEVLGSEELTVAGRPAVAREIEPAPQAGFVPEGSRLYEYVVELEQGVLVATADDIQVDESTYRTAQEVLDRMMASLQILD